VAIISTGDELVAIDDKPNAYQIRRSNSYALQSALTDLGAEAVCFHLEDEKSAMEKNLTRIVKEFDVLILSGGVSKGKFDFVPGVLESIGIRKLFHQVSQRPGKPFWFGQSEEGKIAFALPGNPVSTFMCFYRYVKPWMLRSLGAPQEEVLAILGRDHSFPPPLTCFLQVSVKNEQGRLVAYPDPGGGSGDFANLKNVSGFIELPLEKSHFNAGEVFPYISFRL
jgi:molybdopterin molybdotransferase